MRTLIVEGVKEIRGDLEGLLIKQGFEVDSTDSAKLGLSWALQNKYQLIFSNAWSYESSGLVMIKTLRDAEIECPIILYSARGRWQDLVAGLMVGADDYINFPVWHDVTVARIRYLMYGVEPQASEEIEKAQSEFAKPGNAERFQLEMKQIIDSDKEWTVEEVEREWSRQRERRLVRQARRLKAQSFVYPQLA